MASSSSMASSVSLVMALALFFTFAEARDHLVGGKPDSWKPPSSQSDSLNRWSQQTRFQINDTLVWKYDSGKDSVLEVTREAYLSCNTTSPKLAQKDGETKTKLEKSGPYYFISGSKGNCEKGEKIIVVVMAARSAVSPAMAPAPASGFEAPGVAPTSGATGVKAGFMLLLGGLALFL